MTTLVRARYGHSTVLFSPRHKGPPCHNQQLNNSTPTPSPFSRPTPRAKKPKRNSSGARVPTKSPCLRKRIAKAKHKTSPWPVRGDRKSLMLVSDTSLDPSNTVVADFPPRTQRSTSLLKATTKYPTNLVSPSDLEWSLQQSWRMDPTLLARPTSARCTAAKS